MKRAAIINDLSGLGRCSLNVAISILANLEVQTCPLPTAILSNQTGFEHFSFLDFTPYMREYFKKWQEMGYTFDAIYSGFLGSHEQVEVVLEFIEAFKTSDTLVLIDPVMGDDGVLYPIYDETYPTHMRELIKYADVITPNMTELALLTGIKLNKEVVSAKMLSTYKEQLLTLGPKKIVVTGVTCEAHPNQVMNISIDLERDKYFEEVVSYNHKSYSGTGDIFASILCGCLTRGTTLKQGVKLATAFISKAIAYTDQVPNWDVREGVMYEKFLKELSIS